MMRTKVIKIGNSKGVIIPRHILQQSGLKHEVEIEVTDKNIIIKPAVRAREDWDKAFQEMAKNKDDILLDKDSLGDLISVNHCT
jgi:antitoxin MazE